MTKARGLAGLANAYDDGALSNRNKIINGAMTIDQRNAGAAVTPTGLSTYVLDRWNALFQQASKLSVQRSAAAPAGFINSMVATSLSAHTIVSTDRYILRQNIEGFNTANLGWGTASAQPITVSFWVRSSLTGSFGGFIGNSAIDRSYPFSYTVNAADAWEYKTITVAGDTTGTWLTDSGTGVRLGFSLGVGSDYEGTAGAWGSGQSLAPAGSVSLVSISGATFYITGVQLEAGDTATPFEHRSYGQELALCKRYFRVFGQGAVGIWLTSSTARVKLDFDVEMRTSPTSTIANTAPNFELWNAAAYTGSSSAITAAQASLTHTDITVDGFTSGQSYGAPCYSQTNFAFLSAEL